MVAVISGPEPHRTNLEKQITDYRLQITDNGLQIIDGSSFLIIQGLPADDLRLTEHRDGVDYIPHLPTELLQWYMQEAKEIVCRSGYSSIMDLYTIGRKAHLIPTPGQTEQIYLAEIHK